MSERAYILYKKDELAYLQNHISQCVTKWFGAWCDNALVDIVEVQDLQPLKKRDEEMKPVREEPAYLLIQNAAQHWCVIDMTVQDRQKLAGLFLKQSPQALAVEATGVVAGELVNRAMRELFASYISESDGFADLSLVSDMPSDALALGSGCLSLGVHIGSIEINLVLGGAVLFEKVLENRRIQQDVAKLDTFAEACSQRRVPIQLKIGTAELTLVEVMSMQVGDVLTLDQKITEPARLIVSDNAAEHRCFVGKIGASKAVRLFAS